MSRIFLSYRREDTAAHAGRLYDRLAAHFGPDQLFMDIDRIEPGENFVEAVNRNVGESDVVLVMIGPGWVQAADSAGRRRLDDPQDFVRIEVATALARGVRVIPVRVGGASMPHASELPAPLQPLVERQAIELSDTRFHADVDRLIEAIDKVLAPRPPAAGAAAPPAAAAGKARAGGLRAGLVVGVLVAVAGGGAVAWLMLRGAGDAGSPAQRPAAPVPASPSELAGKSAQPAQPAQPASTAQPASPAASAAAPPSAAPAAPPALRPAPTEVRPAAPIDVRPATPAPQRSGPLKLRVQDTFAPNSTYSAPLRALLGEVGGASAAALAFEHLPSTGVTAAADALAALRRGTLDAAWMLTSNLGGRDEAFNVLEGPPFGPGLARYVAWRGDAKVRAIAERLYAAQDLKGMLCGIAPGWDLWLKAPLQSGAELRGKKLRAIGLRARVYAAAGATVVAMSAAEVQRGLATGALDAAEFLDTGSAVQARLHEVARRWHAAPLSRAVGIELVFRRSVWEQLDAGTRQRIEQVCARGLAPAVKAQTERLAAATTTLRESGAPLAPLPAGVSAALHDAWRRVQAELSANGAAAALLLTVAPYSSN